jgi:hypothetical protein
VPGETDQAAEQPTGRLPELPDYRVYLRQVYRPSDWKEPCDAKDPTTAGEVFRGVGNQVSLWLVESQEAFRRVVVAANQHRPRLKRLDVLPVYSADLQEAGLQPRQTRDNTDCVFAIPLHYDVTISEGQATTLARVMIAAGRALIRCTNTKLKAVYKRAEEEGCFAAVPGSVKCDCQGNT